MDLEIDNEQFNELISEVVTASMEKAFKLGQSAEGDRLRLQRGYEETNAVMRGHNVNLGLQLESVKQELNDANKLIAVFKAKYEPDLEEVEISPDVDSAVEEIAPGLPTEPVFKSFDEAI